MSPESPRIDSSPNPEGSSWEYSLLQWSPENPEGMRLYRVNARNKRSGHGDLLRELRKTRKRKESDLHPLDADYHEKFIERLAETGRFGPSDAIVIMEEDNWERVASSWTPGNTPGRVMSMGFRKQKGPEPSDQAR